MKESKRKRWKMPKRLWSIKAKTLNFQQKRFLAFIWWCAPKGCHCWNNRLAKRFNVTDRTIRRWIANLRKLELIAIGHPDGRGRTIWPRYRTAVDGAKPVKSLPKGGHKCPP